MKGLLVWLVMLLLCLSGLNWARRVGARLPKEHWASASGLVAAPPSRVWEMLTETISQDAWRRGLRRVQVQDPQWTPGTCWTEYWTLMRFPLCVSAQEPVARRVVKTQTWGPMPFDATWTYVLVPVEGGTRVTITEESSIQRPLWRLFGRYWLRGQTAAEQELKDLQAEGVRRR